MAVKSSATITLSAVVDVIATTRYYLLQSSTLNKPTKSSGHRSQTVEIIFNFVGQIEIPILTEPVTLEVSPKQMKTA